jgi:hypothetical protein
VNTPATSVWKQPAQVWAVAFACVVAFMGIGVVDPMLPAIAGSLQAPCLSSMTSRLPESWPGVSEAITSEVVDDSAFARDTTLSTVNPYSVIRRSAGADAPKRFTPSMSPRCPV